MHDKYGSKDAQTLSYRALLVTLLVIGGQLNGQDEKDPHRPVCTSARCRKIKSFVKAHYCSAPEGNGPADGCEIRRPKKLGTDV
jgi:hypothetical protein